MQVNTTSSPSQAATEEGDKVSASNMNRKDVITESALCLRSRELTSFVDYVYSPCSTLSQNSYYHARDDAEDKIH